MCVAACILRDDPGDSFSHVRVASRTPRQGSRDLSNPHLGATLATLIESHPKKDFNATPTFTPLLKAPSIYKRWKNWTGPTAPRKCYNRGMGANMINFHPQKEFNVTPAFVPLLKARFTAKPSRNKSRVRGCVFNATSGMSSLG